MEFSGLARSAKRNNCTRHLEKENKKKENVTHKKKVGGGFEPALARIMSNNANR